jgi:hypothetical protein
MARTPALIERGDLMARTISTDENAAARPSDGARTSERSPPAAKRVLQGAIVVLLTLIAASAAAWVSLRGEPSTVTDVQLGGDPTPERGVRQVEPAPAVAAAFDAEALARFNAAPTPVLAPSQLSADGAAQFARTFRATPDGYFARVDLPGFDVVVNGSRAFGVAPESAGARSGEISQLRISESETGLSAMFRRYGVDYQIEFACRGPGDEAGARCITPEEARAVVDSLVAVGGGG